jgi:hypothetical protein
MSRLRGLCGLRGKEKGKAVTVVPLDDRLNVRVRRHARANQVPVAVRTLNAANRRPELVLPRPRRRECGALASVCVLPSVANHSRQRMRRVLQRIVGPISDP